DLRARADNGNSYAAGRLVGLTARDRQDIDQDTRSVPQEAALLAGCFMGDPCNTARGRTRPARTPASPMRMPLKARSTAHPRARRRVAASGADR
ncbi:hypothetical protein, partial [Nonomuraea sp. NPDC049784]|uniref:hypothetical protein n=1 Tax=Nonomuraea sp. NPDC049784 TaxID=3154361 RepID=UPI0033D96D78